MTKLLELQDVSVEIPTPAGTVRAVDHVDFGIDRGEIVGLVGESGSGKSMTARAMLGILPEAAILGGSVMLNGQELTQLGRRDMESVRGSQIAMVFQEPGASLNPVIRVGDQIVEVLRVHRGLRGSEAKEEAARLLGSVGIPEPERRLRSYPHELSGGMKQRVSIAIGFACDPDVLIADEPTTALDVTIQAQILMLLRDLASARGTSLLLISHDLGVVGQVTDRVMVMYAGRVVEEGSTSDVLNAPLHPYTEALLAAAPSSDLGPGERLFEIPGSVPDLTKVPSGCPFSPRCPEVTDECTTKRPPLVSVTPDSKAACLVRYPG